MSFGARPPAFGIFLLLAGFLSFAHSGEAQANAGNSSTPTTGRGQAIAIDFDGIDCATAVDPDEEPAQACSDNSPNPWNDLDEDWLLPMEEKAVSPSRQHKGSSSLATTGSDAVTLRRLGTVPTQLFSAHSSYSLREHIRERAPPGLA